MAKLTEDARAPHFSLLINSINDASEFSLTAAHNRRINRREEGTKVTTEYMVLNDLIRALIVALTKHQTLRSQRTV